MLAAAVITRPVAAWPVATATRLSPVRRPLLVDAADEEHFVVHGQSEQDGEHDHRQENLDRCRGR